MQSQCIICLEYFAKLQKNEDEVNIVTTMCGHVFHNICIEKWIKQSTTCPECRNYVCKERLTKLFINFCNDKKSDAEISFDALKEKSRELVKHYMELQTICSQNFVINLQKDEKMKELQTNFARLKLESGTKDEQIKELQTNFARLKLENSTKDEQIKELQTNFARLKLESSTKDEQIKELQTNFARLKLESSTKDEQIKELHTRIAYSERDFFHQLIKLYNEISVMKGEIERLSPFEAGYQELFQKKEILQNAKENLESDLQHLNTVQTTIKGCFIDVKKILADVQVHVSSEKEKVATYRIATHCFILKQKLDHSREEKTHLQNELTKVKQKLVHSEEQKTYLEIELKLLKKRLRIPSLDSAKRVGCHTQELNEFGYFNSSISVSCDPSLKL
ncbi:unnamed protein product [Larinioides sclopetarius]|uniref:RING-type domain-containing protein n=1 Tax=Larinioides sclopetarius TaxID=280406 RepID=A0AAV2AUI9_9ARAC